MTRSFLWFLVVCVFFVAEGRILGHRREPIRGSRAPLWDEQVANLDTVPGASRGRVKRSESMGRQAIVDELCEVIDEFRGGNSVHRQYFQREGHLDNMDEYLLHNVDTNLENRRRRTRECCDREGEDRLYCFESYHIRRTDHYCRHGRPDIPFKHHTQAWHTHRKDRCCILVGMERLECFRTIRPTAESGEEIPRDDLDPAHDISHYSPVDQLTSQPQQHGEIRVQDRPRPRPSSLATRSTVRHHRRVLSSPTPTRDYCCAAGQVSGSELTSDVFRTCYENAVKMVDFLTSPKPSNCEETFFECCRRATESSQETDDYRALGVTLSDEEEDDEDERRTIQDVQISTQRPRGRSRRIRHQSSRRADRRRNRQRSNREGRRRRSHF